MLTRVSVMLFVNEPDANNSADVFAFTTEPPIISDVILPAIVSVVAFVISANAKSVAPKFTTKPETVPCTVAPALAVNCVPAEFAFSKSMFDATVVVPSKALPLPVALMLEAGVYVSKPSPPSTKSAPRPPIRESLPAFPTSESLPCCPSRVSFPALPMIVSIPSPPFNESLPLPPRIESLPAVPTTVVTASVDFEKSNGLAWATPDLGSAANASKSILLNKVLSALVAGITMSAAEFALTM